MDEKDIDDHSAPLEGVGFSPNHSLNNIESSNDDYLNNSHDGHPGLLDIQNGSTLPITIGEFCSYVHQTPIGETSASVKSLKDSLFDTPHDCERGYDHTDLNNEQSCLISETNEVERISHKILVSETQSSISCKRKEMDDTTLDACGMEKKYKISEVDYLPASTDIIISPNFDNTNDGISNEKKNEVSLEMIDPPSNLSLVVNTIATEESLGENLISHKSLSFMISESQDLAKKEQTYSIINDSNEEYSSISCSDDEASKIDFKAEEIAINVHQKESVIAVKGSSTILPTSSAVEKEKINEKLCTTPNVRVKSNLMISAYTSSSSEPDNSNDEDYHPTQLSPHSFFDMNDMHILSPKIKKAKKSTKKAIVKKESSELGNISSAKKRVKFQQESSKKRLFGGMRMVVTISSSSNTEQSALTQDWMLDKTKLTKKIKEYGGLIVNDLMKSFQVQSSKKNIVLMTISPLRTKKFLLALALGIPIVSVMWIQQCINEGKVCDFNAFRLCNGDSILLGQPCAALKSTLGIFKETNIFIYAGSTSLDHNTKEAIKDWTEILLASDANVVDKSVFKKKGADYVLVLVSDLTEREIQLFKNCMVTTEFIIQCLRHQSLLPRESHPLFISN